MRIGLALLIALLLPQDGELDTLITQLKVDDIAVRDEAFNRLKAMGDKAEAALEVAAKDPHPELSTRAGKLLNLIRVRRILTPNLRALSPGIEQRIAFSQERAWAQELNAIFKWEDDRRDRLKREDLEPLAPRAFQHSHPEDREDLVGGIRDFRLRSALPTILDRLEFLDGSGAESLLDDFDCLEQARPIAVKLLKHPEASVRREAIDLLDRLDAYEVHPLVLPLLEDESSDVQEAAIWFFGSAKRPEAVPALKKIMEGPHEDNWFFALEVLTRLSPETAIPRLLAAGAEKDAYDRQRLAGLMSRYDAKTLSAVAIDLLDDPESRVRLAAVQTLGEWKMEDSYGKILPLLLDDRSGGVRVCAARALLRINRSRALPEIRKLLAHENLDFRITAVEALANAGDTDSIPGIAAFLESDSSDLFRVTLQALVDLKAVDCVEAIAKRTKDVKDFGECVTAIVMLKGAKSARVLLPMLESSNSELIIRIVQWISKDWGEESRQAVKRLLTHKSEDVRLAAVRSLERFGDPSVAPALRPLLKDEVEAVRWHATLALGTLEDQESIASIRPLLQVKPETRMETVTLAIQAVGKLKDKASVPDLLRFLNQRRFKYSAFEALSRIKDPASYPAMTTLLDDPEQSFRSTAVHTFGAMKSPFFVSRLIPLLKDEDHQLRRDVVKALGRIASPESLHGVTTGLADRREGVRVEALMAIREHEFAAAIPDVLKLLKDPKEDIRDLAADTLGWLGSREGAVYSLGTRGRMMGLNLLRHPEPARKLKAVRVGIKEGEPLSEALDRLAKTAGFTWRGTPETLKRLRNEQSTYDREDEERSLLLYLERYLDRNVLTLVVEGDGVILMTKYEALPLYRKWLAETKEPPK